MTDEKKLNELSKYLLARIKQRYLGGHSDPFGNPHEKYLGLIKDVESDIETDPTSYLWFIFSELSPVLLDFEKGADGRLTFTIDPTFPRQYIHLVIDYYLDMLERQGEIMPTKKRFRKEAWDALKVWEMRRLRMPFNKIAAQMNIKEDAAKKRYYRAFEMIYGKPYDPVTYEKPEIKREYLKRECSTCTENPDNGGTCDTPCPDVLPYVNQDTCGLSDTVDRPIKE